MGWSNPEVDKLIEDLELEFDPKKRVELSTKILHAYTDEVPVIPLYYRSDIAVLPANMVGFHLNGHLSPSTNHVESWELK
jgi:peptide/nickel transport system substrate-binding protein